jgi:tetratricopeptide (TPR) repeat protein
LSVEIRTVNDCYVLIIDPAEIDLWEFRRLVTRARHQAGDGRLAASVSSLRQALELWRGNALAGVPGALVRREAELLEAEQIAAYEELFSAEIRLGDHRRVVPELQKIVSTNPFHESLRALLMYALYASGRQVEALQQFAQFRQWLRRDQGIDPGQELRDLHLSILAQRPPELIAPVCLC